MRKIKFRFYSEVHNEMISWDKINKNHLHHYLSGKIDNVKSMQFTGLKDKNQKEIYEGDIIKGVGVTSYNKSVIRRVAFDDASARFGLSDVNRNITFEPLKWISFPLEIIGNIYENPELLESSGEK